MSRLMNHGSSGRQDFLSRWSRLKRQSDEMTVAPAITGSSPPVSAVPSAPAVPLPNTETLVFGDDFTGFLRQEVEETVRRVALKKLFHSAEFNVMDGLDTYIDDYSIPDPLDEATLRSLNQARDLIFDTPVANKEAPELSASLEPVNVQDEAQAQPEAVNG